ncbi:hypothetical protein RB600_008252 [Gaeumannomyces tritici]
MSTTYSVTMAELKEPPHGNMWAPNYATPVHMQTSRFAHHGVDSSGMSSPAAAAPPYQQAQHHPAARPRNPSMEAHQYPYSRYSQEEADAYDRQQHHQAHPQHSLTSHHSYPNLKRPYSHTEQAPYTEMVQDLRDDGSKLSVSHDQKLLSFKRVPEKNTILDQHGRVQVLDMSAQLHGMFFLSEMPSSSPDGSVLQPELTCYRRNLFQISGSLWTPKGQLSVVTETGETVPVSSTEVTISAIESVDGHSVRLIVIPWKTPPPNSPELNPGPDQEPTSLPLIPFGDEGHPESAGECAVYPIGWRRLQFRIATANNGRRKELQQHFVLHLKVIATLTNGNKAVLAESTTAPIVVRGRSPRNFQARKEIPLLGSSAGSRGQALVETGMGIVAGPLTMKPSDKSRSLTMDLPRTAFTFTAGGPKMPPSPMTMRSNSYPASWNPTHVPHGQGAYPATTMSAADSYPHKLPLSGANSFTTEPQDMGQQTSVPAMQLSLAAPDHQQPPIRTQYAYVPSGTSAPPQLSISTTADNLSVPRYVDSNPRPAKSPRHGSHQSIGSVAHTEPSPEYRYGPPAPYGSVSSNGADISPHTQHPPTPYSQAGVGGTGSGAGTPSLPHVSSAAGGQASTVSAGPHSGPGSNPTSASAVNQTNRDYFPPTTSWTTTAGEAPATVSYANGDSSRPYAYPDYKPGPSPGILKTESQSQAQHAAPPPPPYSATARGSFDGMNHYSWNAT